MRQARLLAALRPAIEGAAAAHQGARLTVACDATRLLVTQPPAHTAAPSQRWASRSHRSTTRRLQHTAVLIDQDEDEDEQDASTAQRQQPGGQSHGCGLEGGAGGQRPGSPRSSKQAEPFRRTATEGPLSLYEEGRATGRYRSDPRQEVCIQLLQEVYLKLRQEYPTPQRPSGLTLVDNVGVTQGKSSWWTGVSHLLRSSSGLAPQPHLQPAHHVEGLYLYGGVGTGKTMLMDLFVEAAPKEFQVRRCHFHDFMLDAHTKLQEFKADPNPLLRAADAIAASTKVLCLDELVVNDVGDAMILNRLFTRLWQQGLTLIATSNRDPDMLYKGGLQRHLFLPFITGLKKECTIHDMASPTDYRRLAHHHQGLYLLTPDRENLLQERLHQLVAQEHRPLAPAHVEVAMGRTLRVPAAAGRVCHFTFEELCGKPLGSPDYIAVAKNYHTLLLSGVPAFGASNLPLAYRFVTLIDVLYDHKIRMVISAAAPPFELFEKVVTQAEARGQPAGAPEDPEVSVDDRLAFTRERTISRLTEMGSLEYLLAHAEAHAPELVLALKEAQDKHKRKEGGRG